MGVAFRPQVWADSAQGVWTKDLRSGSPNEGGRFGCGVLPSGGNRKNGPVAPH